MTARLATDPETIRDALIVLSAYLPHFSDDPSKRERAAQHQELREDAFAALDRLCDRLSEPRVERRTRWPL